MKTWQYWLLVAVLALGLFGINAQLVELQQSTAKIYGEMDIIRDKLHAEGPARIKVDTGQVDTSAIDTSEVGASE
jgi:hypothetical protein